MILGLVANINKITPLIKQIAKHSVNSFYFSKTSPKISPQIKVFGMIQQLKNSSEVSNILVQMSNLNDKFKQKALQMLLQKIQNQEIDFNILTDQKFNIHAKRFPKIYFDCNILRLNYNLYLLNEFMHKDNQQGRKTAAKEVNRCFVICFDSVKKLSLQQALGRQIELHKLFAHYNSEFLVKLIDKSKIRACYNKARQYYKSCLDKIQIQFKLSLQKLTKSKQLKEQTSLDKQIKQKSMQKIIQQLAQSLQNAGVIICEIAEIQIQFEQNMKQIQKQHNNVSKKQVQNLQDLQSFTFSKEIYQFVPSFKKVVQNYQILINNIGEKQHLQFYLKSRKIYIESQYQQKLYQLKQSNLQSKDNNQKKQTLKKQFISKIQQLRQSCIQNIQLLQKNQQNMQPIVDVCSVIASLCLHRISKVSLKNQEFSDIVGNDMNQATKGIKDKNLKKKVIAEIIKFCRQNFGVNVERHLDKIPRSMRIIRKK